MGQNFSVNPNRSWMDWKKLFLHFILLNSQWPSLEDVQRYKSSLKMAASNDGTITLSQFLQVSLLICLLTNSYRFRHGLTSSKASLTLSCWNNGSRRSERSNRSQSTRTKSSLRTQSIAGSTTRDSMTSRLSSSILSETKWDKTN